MSRSIVRPIAVSLFATVLSATPGRAGPADDIIALLDRSDVSGWMSYEAVVETDNGVDIRGLRLGTDGLALAGLLTFLDGSTGGAPTPPAPGLLLSIDTLHLNDGTLAAIFGVTGGAMPDSIAVRADGFVIDLAALPGLRYVDLLRQHIGDARALSGSADLAVVLGTDNWHDVQAHLALADGSSVDLRLQIDEHGAQIPSGAVQIEETAARVITGLWVFGHRLPAEMALMEVEAALDQPGSDGATDAELNAAAIDLRATLSRFPSTGPEGASAMADWAQDMAQALPEHRDLFAAVEQFGRDPGHLRLVLSPPASGSSADVSPGDGFYDDPAAIAAMIETLGLTASYNATP